uniref:Uncharacterized protein n=1 Tax=Chrysotila carterae TaxID=13221 RepID=A0A7S4C012_CHRCT
MSCGKRFNVRKVRRPLITSLVVRAGILAVHVFLVMPAIPKFGTFIQVYTIAVGGLIRPTIHVFVKRRVRKAIFSLSGLKILVAALACRRLGIVWRCIFIIHTIFIIG